MNSSRSNVPMRIRRTILCLAAVVVAAPAANSVTPMLLPGWPVVSGYGPVLPGPGGGVVVVTETGRGESTVAALGLNRRRVWLSAFRWGCGNCAGGPHRPGLQPDGTYGPLGPQDQGQPGAWAVNQAGVVVAGCLGVTLADGTCISAEGKIVRAERSGATLWEYADPALTSLFVATGSPRIVVADGVGGVYTSPAEGFDPITFTRVPTQFLAIDALSGTLRWRRETTFSPLVSLATGVLAGAAGGLVAYNADGTTRWTAPLPEAELVERMLNDEPHNRIYVQLVDAVRGGRAIAAFDATSGVELWRTSKVDGARILSVGAQGMLYVGIDNGDRPGLRAIGPEGRGRWQFHTTREVRGALGLKDGTVAFSSGGLLWRIDPRRPAIGVQSPAFRLSRHTFSTSGEDPGRLERARYGTILRVASPRKTKLRVRITDPAERTSSVFTIPVPSGVSYTRLFADLNESGASTGTRRIDLKGVFQGHTRVARFVVTLVPMCPLKSDTRPGCPNCRTGRCTPSFVRFGLLLDDRERAKRVL